MLQSYEAIYDNGTLKWVKDSPQHDKLKVIVTVVEENISASHPVKKREPSRNIAGKGKTLGELIAPIVSENEWDHLK